MKLLLFGCLGLFFLFSSVFGEEKSLLEEDNEIVAKSRVFRVYADKDFQLKCLDIINSKRYLHDGTPPLVLGYNFTKYTLDRAHSILRDIENKHDITKGKHPFGESFFWYYDPQRYRSLEDAVNTWYEESKNYDYNKPGFSAKTGGFTQLIWKSSREATCVKVEYETESHFKTLVVANFWPAGNVNGEFPYNVLPPSRSKPDLVEDYPINSRPTSKPRPRPPYLPSRPSTNRPVTRPPYKPSRPDYERPPYDPSRPDYDRPTRPDYDRPPNRPNQPDYERPPSRPSRPDYDRPPSKPSRPDYDRPPSKPSRPDYDRPPYEPSRPDYDRPPYRPPYRPGKPSQDYPTHPITNYHEKSQENKASNITSLE